MKRNITFIVSHLGLGGAERVISVLANKLVNVGFNVTIIFLFSGKQDYDLDENIECIKIESRSKLKVFRLIDIFQQLIRILKSKGKTIIISFLIHPIVFAVPAAKLTGNKVIISERTDPNNDPGTPIKRKIRNLVFTFSDLVVLQTHDAYDYFSRKIQKKSNIIANPIKDDLPSRFTGVRKNEIVAVCRLNPQKNLKMLIQAYYLLEKDYPQYILSIYGEGEEEEELKELVSKLELSDKIHFKGFYRDIHSRIIDAAMYVSSSNYEGISNSMLEAMALGIPSIVTDCPIGGARMVIKNGENGILIPVGDINALYNSMKFVIENKEFAKNISKQSVKIREEYSTENIIKQWVVVIDKLSLN